MTLEEQLLLNLIETYKLKGRNVQRILDNQLFRDLPLDKKVLFLKKYSEQLGTAPQANYTNGLLPSGLVGAISGLATVSKVAGPNMTNNKAMLAAGIGAAGFAGMAALANRIKYKNDLQTATAIASGNGMDALVSRTLQQDPFKLRELDPYTPIDRSLNLVAKPELAAFLVRK